MASLLKKFLILFLIISATLAGAVVRAEEGVTVEAEGESPIINGNQLQAKQIATSDALRRAVEQVMGIFIDNQSDVTNYQMIRDTIRMTSEGFVARYEVINEYYDTGRQLCRVTVRAVVKQDAVRQKVDELKRTIVRAGKPRLMVAIAEPTNTLEPLLIRGMIAAGFPVVDPAQLRMVNEDNLALEALAGNPGSAVQIAGRHQAEILVVGKIQTNIISNYQGLISCRAVADLRAIKAGTGQNLLAQSFQEIGIDISETGAAQKAVQKMSDRIIAQLKNDLGQQLIDNNRSLQLVITRISYSDWQAIQQQLIGSPGVRNVYLRDFSGGVARLDVETSLLADQLAGLISGWKNPVLEVTALSADKIEFAKNGL
jgi:hypothetical protein